LEVLIPIFKARQYLPYSISTRFLWRRRPRYLWKPKITGIDNPVTVVTPPLAAKRGERAEQKCTALP
jgi:hypothetical protein